MTTTVTLNNGVEMPRAGLGVYRVSDVAACESSVGAALAAGCRLVDTAAVYGNERAVGRGLRASAVPREDVFVTTKLWPSDYRPARARAAIAAALERLGTPYVDLMLLHQPVGDVLGAWGVLEEALAGGRVRAIGVSNFTVADLEAFLPAVRVVPAVDQVELHPYWPQRELVGYLRAHRIVPEAWFPLGHGSVELLGERVIAEAATVHGKAPAQVILRWHRQSDVVAIPKSTDPAHIAQNLDIEDFVLTDAEMARIDGLARSRPLFRAPRALMSATTRLMRPRQLR